MFSATIVKMWTVIVVYARKGVITHTQIQYTCMKVLQNSRKTQKHKTVESSFTYMCLKNMPLYSDDNFVKS